MSHHHHHHHHHLKRLQHDVNPDLHSSSYNQHAPHSTKQHKDSLDHRSRIPNEEIIRESIQNFTLSANNKTKLSRPFNPGPQRARRGGSRHNGHHWHSSSLSLPKRTINYDLAESFMDHSTNGLSSDLYKIKFKHSTKIWPNGRFMNYKEKLDKSDGNMIDIICTRTFPVVAKRKKIQEVNQNERNNQQNISMVIATAQLLNSLDPVIQEEKRKQVNQQSNFYANLFGGRKIPRLPTTAQIKKMDPPTTSTPLVSTSLLTDNYEHHPS
ncbi:unnamed protein product [Rotaria socialis]|uniref:Uncharacterized protein n=1 Tax=Rotaria socialis TaxID=392032 RepID=A0A818U8B5_9BILA|nr:unnamed protein product [Rotaria socialis]CAF4215019.1 unnamed protein product [Rotaria socialis]